MSESKRTHEMLKQMQELPLEMKIQLTKSRIREWVREFGENGVYISFSGGKDSTVLLHLVREMYPNVEAVFCNTGLEFPEIQQFAKSFENVTVIRPEKSFIDVIKEYGYPMISKEVSEVIYEVKQGSKYSYSKCSYRLKKLNGTLLNKNGNKSRYCCEKYKPIYDWCDFEISNRCCKYIKKQPLQKFERETGKKRFTAEIADESFLREQTWYKYGCNAFNSKQPKSKPMSFWTENDVCMYVCMYNIPICSVYGEVIKIGENKYTTTKAKRTGCIFCGYGCHHDDRFLRLKETHPRQYDYCINGGEFDENGIWKPNKLGLGMGHVFDELNYIYEKELKSGEIKPFIKYK